jgi:AraC-like DNA-binding protein
MKKKTYSKDEIEMWEHLSKFNHIFARNFTIDDSLMEQELHTHDFGLLNCVKKGIVRIATENDSWVISHNTIFYLPPNLLHITEVIGECSVLAVFVPTRLNKILPKQISILEFTPLLNSILERMTTWEFKPDYSPEQQRLARVAEDELKNAKKASFFHIPMPKDERLQKMTRKILQSPEDMSSIETWAKFSGMSLRSFTRYFTDETGLAFTEWRQRVKIYTALKLLSQDVSVSDVSFNLGYQNVSTFIAMFKGHIGCSPTEYIKRAKTVTEA